jgi:hypothetical protein
MLNTARKEVLISIKDAATLVFGTHPNRIPRSTIQTWIQRGIIMPEQPVPHRDPRGCRLSISDLVVLSLLRAFMSVGLQFNTLLFGGQRQDFLEFEAIRTKKAFEAVMQELDKERGRSMQVWLEMNDFCAVVRISWRGDNPSYPHYKFYRYDSPALAEDFDTVRQGEYLPPRIFIDAGAHHSFVVKRLVEQGVITS